MTDVLRIPSDREPVVDPATGRCTRSWYLFFSGILVRLGGVIGPGNEAADMFSGAEGSPEMTAALYQLAQEFGQAPTSLVDEIAELAKEIQAIKSGTVI